MESRRTEMLLEVRTELDHQDNPGLRPRGSPSKCRGSFKCAASVAAALGALVLVLAVGFCLHLFLFSPSCKQEQDDVRCTLKESAEKGIYDIFTVNKSGTYRIHGWIRFKKAVPATKVTLIHKWNKEHRTLNDTLNNKSEVIFFFTSARMASDSQVSLRFDVSDNFSDSGCHVHKLS